MVCEDAQQFGRICKELEGYAWICIDLQGFVWICTDLQRLYGFVRSPAKQTEATCRKEKQSIETKAILIENN